MLVTGERILDTVDANGRHAFTIDSRSAAAEPLLAFRLGAARSFVPEVALPYLGSQLDPALFNGAALTTLPARDTVPVLVDWHGSSVPAMSWLTNQRAVAAGETSGEITAASSAPLRRALTEQSGTPGTWSGPLAGIDHIALNANVSPPPPTPQFVQYTLTINGLDTGGRPDNGGFLVLMNTDDGRKFINAATFSKGVIKLSVPLGHYSAIAQFFHGSTTVGSLHVVVVNFTVSGNATATVDARSATSEVSVTTPRGTSSGTGAVQWQRVDSRQSAVAGVGFLWGIGAGIPRVSVFVSPSAAPAIGSQAWLVAYHLDSAQSAPQPYSYDLDFGSVGSIPVAERYAVDASQLASVDTRYFSDVAGRPTGAARVSFFPWQLGTFGTFDIFPAPLERTEYVNALPDLTWTQQVIESITTFGGMFLDSPRQFRPGEVDVADWGRGPTGPGVAVITTGAATQGCPACFEANTLEFQIFPFGDNPPGHVGFPNPPFAGVTEKDTTSVRRNGKLITSTADPLGPIPVPPGAASYQLTYSVALFAPWWTLSTRTSTTWRFAIPQSLQSPPPPGWTCFSGTTNGCGVIGLMVADYELPMSLLNQLPSGQVSFPLQITHVLDVAIPVTSARVSVSFDGGTTWQPAAVTPQGSSGFTVSYANPSNAATASLRIHAIDSNGGALDQTIINAYAIAS